MKEQKNLEYYDKLPYNIILEQWDDGSGPYWVARVLELPHCLIHGDTPEEAIREIQEVKREWLKSNLERGLKIPEPVSHEYSGQVRLRIPPSLHKVLSHRAAAEDVSLNQFMTAALAGAAGVEIETKAKGRKRRATRAAKASLPRNAPGKSE
ncbi:MAG: type II toxin-antitoxin system HicB family antitoxin [Chloroflexi bacterium]|nr:type II toxin-antitoxin system HicB family antitoxin [Chloroflexota bacterium]